MNASRTRVGVAHVVGGCFALAGCIAALLSGSAAADEPPPPKGRMLGTVAVRGTNEPVAGARIRVFIGKENKDEPHRLASVETTSDANGRYVLELPMGHARTFRILLPPGYWSSPEIDSFATTPDAPEYTRHYRVERGPIWRVRIDADEQTAPLLPDVVVSGRRLDAQPHVAVQTLVDESGLGLLTLPEAGGTYGVSFYEWNFRVVSKTPAKLSIEPGFQPQRIAHVARNDDTRGLTFVDNNGRKATLTGCDGALVDGQAELRFSARSLTADETFSVSGCVVDDRETPLADAIVVLGSESRQGGGTLTPFHCRTDDAGRFTISGLSRASYLVPDQQLSLTVTREGFAGVDTRPRSFPADAGDEPLDFGSIRLSPGHQVRLRVLDPEGKPVQGAWIEPAGSFAARGGFARTDAEGRCTLRNLSLGVQGASVQFGRAYAQTRLVVIADDAEEVIVRLVAPPAQPATIVVPQSPLAAGEEAPEWDVVTWTDGIARSLSDYRGKVVVIDVWGVWCSPCVHAIPGLKQVQERFRSRDVAFLGIHTAGTDLEQVRRLMKFKEWDWPTGLDAGDDMTRGRTVQRYRVRGYPTIIVIGRDGRVAFNSDDEMIGNHEAAMNEMEQLARELDIPWPLPEEITSEKAIPLMNQILAHRISRQVEAALARDAQQRSD